jgi:large subunit ribosomal protein L10
MTDTNRGKGSVRPSHAAKQKEVDLLADRFKRAEVAIVVQLKGLSVEKDTTLRADLRKGKSELKVVKNTLAKRAIKGTKYESLKDLFKGPVAVALSYSDVSFPAKTLDDFQKAEKGLTIVGGSMAGKNLSVADVKELAGLPTLPVGRGMLLGMFLQPGASMARLLDKYAEKLGGGKAAEAKAEEKAPASETPPAAPAAPTAPPA